MSWLLSGIKLVEAWIYTKSVIRNIISMKPE